MSSHSVAGDPPPKALFRKPIPYSRVRFSSRRDALTARCCATVLLSCEPHAVAARGSTFAKFAALAVIAG